MKAILFFLITTLGTSAAAGSPHYASDDSRKLIEAMIEAHGGLERWQHATTISFDNLMHNNLAGKQELAWWYAHEIIDQETRQVAQEWPFDNARLGFDGENVWTENWNRGNPPEMMTHFFYYFVNLPWLTQDKGVQLGDPKTFTWPGLGLELLEVEMGFNSAPAFGKTADDYFVLYIDPGSKRLVGYQYAMGNPDLLRMMGVPKDRKVFGPMWRMITRYTEVDGLLFPSAFRTSPEPDGRIVGNHAILNIRTNVPFDEAKTRTKRQSMSP